MQKLLYVFMPVLLSLAGSLCGAFIGDAFIPDIYGKELLTAGIAALLTLVAVLPVTVKEKELRICRHPAALPVYLAGGAIYSLLSARLMEAAGITAALDGQAQAALYEAPPAAQLLILAVIVPVSEELVYRGLFFGRLKKEMPLWAAVLICSSVFALGHGNALQILYALPSGVILCLIAAAGGDVASSAAFHAGANLASVLVTMAASL